MKEKKKLELLKIPIMATTMFMGLMPGIPTYNTRFLFFLAVIAPFLPIIKLSSTFENENVFIFTFFYFIIYLITNISVGQYIKKIGKQWSIEQYNLLKPDQVTFPFIMVLIINSGIHFTIYYLILKLFVL